MKVKKVLIIGGSGFLGSSVVDEFIKKKIKVTVLDKKKPHLKSSYLNFIHSDISNEKERIIGLLKIGYPEKIPDPKKKELSEIRFYLD